ncbi:MAG: DUF222 domain-containing protein [Gordonia sp. (in: high G+C Gram-positive bacteria)]|uniref:DUF222 domain-containing protein n=1 Tax=Gordonia sp. (in: high G+C Gram-positive bacteria) TaxID=84139 RepID=UPI003BB6D643
MDRKVVIHMTALRTSMWPTADLSGTGVATAELSGLSLPELGQAMNAAKHGHSFLDWQQFQYALATFDAIEAGKREALAVRTNLLDVYAQAAIEVQVGLESTEYAAHALLDDAFAARDRLPLVAQLLRAGQIDRRRFRKIVIETDLVTDPALMAVLDQKIAAHLLGLGSVTSLSEAKTAGLARQFVAQVDPEAVRERREEAKRRRRVSYRVLEDGLGQVTVVVTAEDMRLMNKTIDAVVAGLCKDDPRTKDQARADAVTALVLRNQFVCQCESLSCTAQIRAAQVDARLTHILIHVLADNATLEGGNICGYVDGYGPISADHVREIASRGDAAIRQHNLTDLLEDQVGDEPSVHRQPPRPDTPGESGGGTPCPEGVLDDPGSWFDWEPPAEWFECPAEAEGDRSLLVAADPAGGEFIPVGPPPQWVEDWDAALAALVEVDGAAGFRVIAHTALPSDGYRPNALTEVIARFLWGTCSVLGCERAAFSCDLDHVAEYDFSAGLRARSVLSAQGGPTCLCNLLPKCRFHHLVKTNLEGFVDELWIDADGRYHSAMTTPGGLTVEMLAPNQWLLPSLTGLRCTHQQADLRSVSSGEGTSAEDAPRRVQTRTQAKHARRRAERKANQAARTACDAKEAAKKAAANAQREAAQNRYEDSAGDPPF